MPTDEKLRESLEEVQELYQRLAAVSRKLLAVPAAAWTPEILQESLETRQRLFSRLERQNRPLNARLRERQEQGPPLPPEIVALLEQQVKLLQAIRDDDQQLHRLLAARQQELLPELEKAREFDQLLQGYHSPKPAPEKPRFFKAKI